MDKIIIGVAFISVLYLFYNLIRMRIKNEKHRQVRVYVLIVLILILMFIWNIFRQ